MKLEEAKKILISANKWRRDDIGLEEMPNPTKLGIAIDEAIKAITKLEETEEGTKKEVMKYLAELVRIGDIECESGDIYPCSAIISFANEKQCRDFAKYLYKIKQIEVKDIPSNCNHPHLAWEDRKPVCQDCGHIMTLSEMEDWTKGAEND